MNRDRAATTTTSSSSAPAAPACAPRSPPARPACASPIICKSLFGKAHTVMAEGGIAASMGNVNCNDNWQVHFRDTMRGGKFLNNLADGRAARQGGAGPGLGAGDLRRAVRPHAGRQDQPAQLRRPRVPAARPRRRPHRPRADPHPAAEDRLAAAGRRARARRPRGPPQGLRRVHDHRPAQATTAGAIAGAFGYWRETGRFVRFQAPAVVLATGGIGKSFKVTTQLVGVHRRRARAGAARRLDADQHGVRPVPPDRHGLAAVGQGHPGHRVGPRRRRRAAQLRGQAVHVRLRPRRVPRPVRRDRGGGATAGTPTRTTTSAHRSCCPATRSPGRSTPRSRPAAAHRTAASSSTSPRAARRPRSCKRLPSMHHQFKELADVDITEEPMEVGPTCHYVMGGVEVDPDTAAAARVPGLFAAGEVAGGMHGSNRLGGNSLSDLLVFGRRAGVGAADYVDGPRAATYPTVDQDAGRRGGGDRARRRSSGDGAARTRTRCTRSCSRSMNDLVGIIRKEEEIAAGARRSSTSSRRAAQQVSVEGHRQFNPGWHLALDLRNMLLVSECVARAALMRQESRGGHTRDDFPAMDPSGAQKLLVCSLRPATGTVEVDRAADVADAADLLAPVRARRAEEVPHRRRAARRSPPRVRRKATDELRRARSGSGAATPTAASCATTPSR